MNFCRKYLVYATKSKKRNFRRFGSKIGLYHAKLPHLNFGKHYAINIRSYLLTRLALYALLLLKSLKNGNREFGLSTYKFVCTRWQLNYNNQKSNLLSVNLMGFLNRLYKTLTIKICLMTFYFKTCNWRSAVNLKLER
jgi:hypothetical protein